MPGGPTHTAIHSMLQRRLDLLTSASTGWSATAEVLADRPSVGCSRTDPLAAAAADALAAAGQPTEPEGAAYFSDGAIYGPARNAPVILLGPGEPSVMHAADEHVAIPRFLEAIELYDRLIQGWFERAADTIAP